MIDRLTLLTEAVSNFRKDRPTLAAHDSDLTNVAQALVGEAGELLVAIKGDKLTVGIDEQKKDIEQELADVIIYTLTLADDLGINVIYAAMEKIARNCGKYPAVLFKSGDYHKSVEESKKQWRDTRGQQDFYREEE